MSIAENEAEKAYPTRYWDGTHVKEQFYCDTDDLQEAYLLGRNAPPTNAEIEAVAKRLLWRDMVPVWEDDMPSEDDLWNRSEQVMQIQAIYLKDAKEMLEIARKTVNE